MKKLIEALTNEEVDEFVQQYMKSGNNFGVLLYLEEKLRRAEEEYD